MQYTPYELKEKLLRGLDVENNVVDLPMVLGAISILEKYPITKEALEQTRIGRYVNELRKKTNDKDLAKRAKNLVRKWQQFINSPSSTSTSTINGERVACVGGRPGIGAPGALQSPQVELIRGGSKPSSPASRPDTPSSVRSSNMSPGLPSHTSSVNCSRPDTPCSSQPRYSPKLPATQTGGRACTPGSKPASPAITRNSMQSRVSPRGAYSHVAAPESKPASPALAPASCPSSSQRLSPGLPRHLSEDTRSNSPVSSASRHGAPSKTNVANKRKRRLEHADCDLPIKKNNDNSNGNDEEYKIKLKGLNGMIHGANSHTDLEQQQCGDKSCSSVGEDLGNTQTHIFDKSREQMSQDNKLRTPEPSLGSRRCTELTIQTDLPDREQSESCRTPLSADSQRGKLDRTPSTPSMSRTPKVKSTAELIRDLYSKGSLRITGSKTVEKIARNQIEKEPDTIDQPVVPPEAKPRPRRKPGLQIVPPNASEKTLSETKNEMVHKFLQSSVSAACMPTSSSDVDLSGLMAQASLPVESPHEARSDASLHDTSSSSISIGDVQTGQSHTGVSSLPSRVIFTLGSETLQTGTPIDAYPELPPLNEDEINWDDEYEVPPRKEVTDNDVEDLNSKHLPGVNGQFDQENVWHSWTGTYSMPTYSGNLLHILPYVNIDD